MIRVAIAENHPEMRIALRLLLKLSGNMKLVAEMSNGLEALDCTKGIQPDVLVMDVRMPGLDGLKATRKIMELAVGTRVVLVSSQRGSSMAMEAIEAGAHGFVPKEEVVAFLLLAIETVHRGETFFAP